MLTVSQYSKAYNGTLVLTVPLLELRPGTYWIKGDNGSGKSTFFKSAGGLMPFDGDIVLNGLRLKDRTIAYRRQVNYAEAEPSYPGFLTARDLVRFVGKARNATRDQQNSLVELFGVDSFFEKPCETFSSGMMKKLSLVIAFLGAPSLIILDEPLITLDEKTRNTLLALISQTAVSGTMFLMSSHQLLDERAFEITSTYVIQNKT